MNTILLILAAAAQEKWKPYQFQGHERYEYRITGEEGRQKREVAYLLEVKPKDDQFEVSWTLKTVTEKSGLNERSVFGEGAWEIPLSWIAVHPAWSPFFADLPLKEGEKLSLFGAGHLLVAGRAKVGGREGFVCRLLERKDETEILTHEWTIDPALALPIRSVLYERGSPKYTMELVGYEKK